MWSSTLNYNIVPIKTSSSGFQKGENSSLSTKDLGHRIVPQKGDFCVKSFLKDPWVE